MVTRMTMHASEAQLMEVASQLLEAEDTGSAIASLTEQAPGLTVADAYQIQQINVLRRVDAGGIVCGHKVGLTSVAMQQQLGVAEPDFGVLFADMLVEEGDPIVISRLVRPQV